MKRIELAIRASTRHPSKAFKLLAAQGIQPLVTGRVLHKSGFVAESVIAVLSHAVEVRLVLSVVAASEAAILVEPSGLKKEKKKMHLRPWFSFFFFCLRSYVLVYKS